MEVMEPFGTETNQQEKPLRWKMMGMIVICWLLPLILVAMIMLYYVSNNLNKQIENTISVSASKAIEICQLRINDAIAASRDASYMPNIRNSYLRYQETGDKERLYGEVKRFLGQHYKYNDSFLSTVLYFTDDPEKVYFTHRNADESTYYFSIRQFLDSGMREVQKRAKDIDTDVIFMEVNDRLYMVRNIMNSDFEPYAVIAMELNKSVIFESLESIWGYANHSIYVDCDECINTGNMKLKFSDKELKANRKEGKYDYEGKELWVYPNNKIDTQRIAYVIEIDSETVVSEMEVVRYIVALWLIFMFPLVAIVFYFLHKNVTNPINGLISVVHKIQDGEYGCQVTEKYESQEFVYLSESFNKMSKKLRHQFEQIYLEELALRDANIMALQSQINPHFLNNTLEIINWEARMMDNYKVSGMIEALSTMLEATMNRKNKQLITLSEELTYVDAYLFIISQRFGEKFKVEKEIDENLMRVEVPRLIIQPIIENAVEHGMDARGMGKVNIRIYAKEEMMYIEIMDNGILTEKDREKIDKLLHSEGKEEHSTSLGIRNVDQRLRIIYGEECGLTIKSNKENRTVSTIIVKMNK